MPWRPPRDREIPAPDQKAPQKHRAGRESSPRDLSPGTTVLAGHSAPWDGFSLVTGAPYGQGVTPESGTEPVNQNETPVAQLPSDGDGRLLGSVDPEGLRQPGCLGGFRKRSGWA